ncbi:hypothetical protein CK203_034520 [Vitis vinifera]|uniref:Uncharacterized protein n=1 Tax=Vitis vinifera TaxID=29760 RepID=A0A438IDS5_VITVI|nr:hypothetical protein CK203_034520 [Vitis vinifera]
MSSQNCTKECAGIMAGHLLIELAHKVSGQEEATNKSLLVALKKRLQGASGRWVEKLLEVLWAHLTMRRRPTGKTLFSLDYDMEVVIPTEIGMLTLQATLGTDRQSRDRS